MPFQVTAQAWPCASTHETTPFVWRDATMNCTDRVAAQGSVLERVHGRVARESATGGYALLGRLSRGNQVFVHMMCLPRHSCPRPILLITLILHLSRVLILFLVPAIINVKVLGLVIVLSSSSSPALLSSRVSRKCNFRGFSRTSSPSSSSQPRHSLFWGHRLPCW